MFKVSRKRFWIGLSVLVLAVSISSGWANVKEQKKTGFFSKKKTEQKLLKAPKFPEAGQWLNSPALKNKDLKDKLSLIYFWDYTSINCIREIETVKKFHETYAAYGLQVLWIHSPEFNFVGQPNHVQNAVNRFGITGPVYLDNDFKFWDAYSIKSWPTKVLVNGDARIEKTFVGEENARKVENSIRRILREMNPGAGLPPRIIKRENRNYNSRSCGVMSGETYVGYKRANWWGATIANQKWVPQDKPVLFKDRGNRVERGFFLNGLWENREDDIRHARETSDLTDYLGLIYLGHEVYGMINTTDKARQARVYVTRDENPVPEEMRGKDLRVDANGGTYFSVDGPRLYYIIANEDPDPHELKLWTDSNDVSIHSFAFSNRCLSDFEHR